MLGATDISACRLSAQCASKTQKANSASYHHTDEATDEPACREVATAEEGDGARDLEQTAERPKRRQATTDHLETFHCCPVAPNGWRVSGERRAEGDERGMLTRFS
jgi:hypothetical protein